MTDYQWAVFQANLDPAVGSEQAGMRPVLVVSNEGYNQNIQNVTIVPLTSTKRDLYPSEIILPREKAGQPQESIIMAHHLRTISKQRLGKLFGYLEDTRLQQQVQLAIKNHLDMD